jgi:hypothetical protein
MLWAAKALLKLCASSNGRVLELLTRPPRAKQTEQARKAPYYVANVAMVAHSEYENVRAEFIKCLNKYTVGNDKMFAPFAPVFAYSATDEEAVKENSKVCVHVHVCKRESTYVSFFIFSLICHLYVSHTHTERVAECRAYPPLSRAENRDGSEGRWRYVCWCIGMRTYAYVCVIVGANLSNRIPFHAHTHIHTHTSGPDTKQKFMVLMRIYPEHALANLIYTLSHHDDFVDTKEDGSPEDESNMIEVYDYFKKFIDFFLHNLFAESTEKQFGLVLQITNAIKHAEDIREPRCVCSCVCVECFCTHVD